MTTPTRILLIERDAAAGAALQQTLQRAGCVSTLVRSGQEAIAELERQQASPNIETIGVVIADQDMPGPENGLGLIRRLHDDWPLVVPIMVSGFRKVESAVAAMRLGAADYLLKPVNEKELIEAVQRAVQRHLLRAEHETAQQEVGRIQASATPRRRADDNTAAAAGTTTYTPTPLAEAMKAPERQILLAALEANGWNRQQTAKDLDINRTTLYKKIRQHRLDEPG